MWEWTRWLRSATPKLLRASGENLAGLAFPFGLVLARGMLATTSNHCKCRYSACLKANNHITAHISCACRKERNNYYRLQRAVQILIQNGGKPMSAQDVQTEAPLDYDFRCFFLNRPRLQLYERVMLRYDITH